ncbi:hypothetical protein DFH08DRAFT_825422 [Mycena albidolilacea]|uniref:Uncharacterized protein n=1 Tax=Mycena albidolilacea TaxID=1033008 RepID=A0AAD6Z244_9AGAR|nr:hypothetical protein DFH08DRAFT_825422 [Mycena albidolilacea]
MSVPCTIPTGSFLLSDFQGLCLTVNITGASPFSPIITEECSRRLPALPQQTWSLATVNHGRVLVSGLSQEAGETVVVAEGSNGQAITAGSTSFGFNVTCVPVDANSVTLFLNRSPEALSKLGLLRLWIEGGLGLAKNMMFKSLRERARFNCEVQTRQDSDLHRTDDVRNNMLIRSIRKFSGCGHPLLSRWECKMGLRARFALPTIWRVPTPATLNGPKPFTGNPFVHQAADPEPPLHPTPTPPFPTRPPSTRASCCGSPTRTAAGALRTLVDAFLACGLGISGHSTNLRGLALAVLGLLLMILRRLRLAARLFLLRVVTARSHALAVAECGCAGSGT